MRSGAMRGVAATLLAVGLAAGCGGGGAGGPGGTGAAGGGELTLEFWHTRRGEQEAALQRICDEYEQANPGVRLEPVYGGGYDELNRKLRGAIQANSLPALSVAYESQVSEYMANRAVRPLDDLLADPEIGFSAEELADIPEQYLAVNRFPQFDNQLLSFPFTKSNLVMYCNLDLIRRAGFSAPPATWEEFEQQAAAISRTLGAPAVAYDVDPSTLDGMIYSFGGEVLADDGLTTLFDQQPTVRAFELLQRMARNRTLLDAGNEDVGPLFLGQRCAFTFGSSASRAEMEGLIGDSFDWTVAPPPHAADAEPVTVMYGPNICLFRVSPEVERAAWNFVRYFTSPEVTARWARETGYLPVRRSAVELPEMRAFYEANPRALRVYEMLPLAKGEPNVVGWQEVRSLLDGAARAVLGGGTSPRDAAVDLKRRADQTLAQSR